jgi:uncharacterized protein (DUF2252 family)
MSTDERRAAARRRPAARVAHPTVEERVARGRTARRQTPRSLHAELPAAPPRRDPVTLLEEQAVDRIPELIPIRYGRMLASPFSFFRGAAAVMAEDLAGTPSSGLRVQLCGDAHLSNFGVFGTPERRLVFDINDFDETLPGPFEWDVKRLAASVVVAARGSGFGAAEREAAVLAGVARYRTAMAEFADMGNLGLFYARPDVEQLLAGHRAGAGSGAAQRRMARHAERWIAKARTRDSASALRRFTRDVDGEPRIASDPPLTTPVSDLVGPMAAEDFQRWARGLLREYRRTLATDRRRLVESYRMVDLARRVVGVGSVGTGAWIALLVGRDPADPLVLQVKEAPPSVLERHLGRSGYRNGGHRVVAGQRLMQAAGDGLLGWIRQRGLDGRERDFYVRQFRDWKGSVEVERLRPGGLQVYAELCGWTLARAHARSGDRVAIAAYMGKGGVFDRAIAAFAEAYADRNAADHSALAAAVDEGRIAARTGI